LIQFVLNPIIVYFILAVSWVVFAQDESSDKLPVFTDSENSVGIFSTGNLGQTAVWGDFNGDGWQDLLISNTDRDARVRRPRRGARERGKPAAPPKTLSTNKKRKLFLFQNDSGLKFTDVAYISGLPNDKIKAASWGDYDNDGLLDLAVATIRAASPPLLYKNQDGISFIDISQEAGLTKAGSTTRHVIWVDYDRDGLLDLFVPGNQLSYLYRNKGGGIFEDASSLAGITEHNNGLSAIFFDADNDGWPDLFLANGGYNKFYLNNGNGTFTDATQSSGLEGAPYWQTTSACSGDYNGDGFLDIYITNIGKAKKNTLYRNNKDGTFTDVTWETGTRDLGDGRTCAWIDFDADGRVDLFTTNHTWSNRLYKNLGNDLFRDVAQEVNLAKPIDVFAATWGDYDRDGFLDIYLNGHIGNSLKRNEGNSNNSITLRLVGDGLLSNRSAIGARAVLSTPAGSQIREVSGGRGGTEQDMLPLYFGLGKFDKADILVIWPSGKECSFKDVSVEPHREFQISETKCDIIDIAKSDK
jgi:enediyne biosynthesis protein E4